MEAFCGSFYWADRVEATRATCYILDPIRFRIITDSWNETYRQDARNMSKALWLFLVTGEFGIPTVSKPSETIRTLRRLFSSYTLLDRQIGAGTILRVKVIIPRFDENYPPIERFAPGKARGLCPHPQMGTLRSALTAECKPEFVCA
jgi:hypothetical protein